MRLRPEERKPGAWDYDGRYNPDGRGRSLWNETFSVGIFQWKAKAGGCGIKRGKVVHRVKGKCVDYEAVYKRAEELCKKFEAGGRPSNKIEVLKHYPKWDNYYGD